MGSRERVSQYLSESGVRHYLKEFDESTKNSALAAQALGCSVAEIAKSVVFVGVRTTVVIISGDKKVDIDRLAKVVGAQLRIAKPSEVRERTGFPVGGVPPFPHDERVEVLADASITRFSHVWAAAGTPNSVFQIETGDLLRLLHTAPVDVAE